MCLCVHIGLHMCSVSFMSRNHLHKIILLDIYGITLIVVMLLLPTLYNMLSDDCEHSL